MAGTTVTLACDEINKTSLTINEDSTNILLARLRENDCKKNLTLNPNQLLDLALNSS